MNVEKWIQEELSKGVEVNRLFPCKYDANGFGYEIILSRKEGSHTQQYKLLLTRKKSERTTLLINQLYKVSLHTDMDEEQACEALKGKKVILTPKIPVAYVTETSISTITGTLTLKSKPS